MEPRTHSVDWELIERYLAGDLRGEERSRAESILRAHPRLREMLEMVEQRLAGADGEAPREVEQAYAALAVRLRVGEHASTTGRPAGPPKSNPTPVGERRDWTGRVGTYAAHQWGRVAVAAMVLVLVGLVVRVKGSRHAVRPLTYATGIGQRATVTLADGSHVILAPQSQLIVDAGFGQGTRSVSLNGEAYFAVRAATGAPFVVRTGAVTTRVLGTQFDVCHYAADPAVRVAVLSGKVAVGGRQTPVILTAGTMGLVTDSTAVSMTGDPRDYATWTEGRLVLRDISVAAMLVTVGRWYGYTFRLADSTLASQHVAVTFDIDRREETLALIRDFLKVTMRFEGTTVTLTPRHQHHGTTTPSRRDITFSSSTGVGK